MKITVVGCGGAFTEELYHQCFMLTENGRNLFIDMGQQIIPFALKNAGLNVSDVHEVIITHGHDDHAGSLGTLGLKRYDWKNRPIHYKDSPIKYAPKLIANEELMNELWDSTKANLRTMEGFVATLDTFFEVKSLKGNEHYNFEGWDIQLIQQIHVMTGSIVMNSFGVYGEKNGKSFFITSDTQYFQPRQVKYFYEHADIIITDCETSGTNFQFNEGESVFQYKKTDEKFQVEFLNQKYKDNQLYTWPQDDNEQLQLTALGMIPFPWKTLKFMSGVHSAYPELAGYASANATVLSSDIKKKIWLSHYGDHVAHNKDGFGNNVDWNKKALDDGFAGFVKLGQVFEI